MSEPQQTEEAGTATEEKPDEQPKPDIDWKAKAREWEKRAKENSTAAKRLSEIEEASKTEQQKLAERAEAAERQAADAQREMARLRVLSEVALPADLHEFVVGNDEDELRAKAQKLKAQFAADQRSVDVGQGPRGTDSLPNMNSLIRRAVGRT